jgi:hypothetical protein
MTRTKLIFAALGAVVCASVLAAQSAPSAPRNLRILSDAPPPDPGPDPSPPSGECGAVALVGGAHSYYEHLASREQCLAAFSLRNAADLAYLQTAYGNGIWNYAHPDPDYLDGPDAARLTYSLSLVGRNQLRDSGHRVTDGSVTWVLDFWMSPEHSGSMLKTAAEGGKGVHTSKFLNIRDGGGIWFNPQINFPTSPDHLQSGQVGRARVLFSATSGLPSPDGFVRRTPVHPPGQGAVPMWPDASLKFRIYENTWTRWILHVDLDLPGTAFTEWSQEYLGGKPLSTWNIVSSVPGPGAQETTITVDEPHAVYKNVRRAGGIDQARVTITGHSVPAVNRTWLASPVEDEPTKFTIPVASVGGSGGIASMHWHRMSTWILDENRDAQRVIYRVPWQVRDNARVDEDPATAVGKAALRTFDLELNSSSSFENAGRGWFLSAAPTIERQTVITTATPHGLRVGDRVMARYSDVLPPPNDANRQIVQRVVEVIGPTQARLDWAVTTASQINTTGFAEGTYGYALRAIRAYFRNWVVLKDVALDEADATIFARPRR